MIDRFSFQGVKISVINQAKAIDALKGYDFNLPSYVCFPDSYTAFSAVKDQKLLNILNNAYLTMPDGKPLEFYARRQGHKDVKTVSGYWTARALLADTKYSHFFYGSTPKILENLKSTIEKEFPTATILGFNSPPFVQIDEIEGNNQILTDIEEIAKLNPDFIWIGISSPKQDYLMANFCKHLNRGLMLGVGGVFEYLSGDVKKSPEWVKKIGLRWLYRLINEPKRLWRKYLLVFAGFVRLVFRPEE